MDKPTWRTRARHARRTPSARPSENLTAYILGQRRMRQLTRPPVGALTVRVPDPPPELLAMLDLLAEQVAAARRAPVRSPADAAALLAPQIERLDRHQLIALYLDERGYVQEIALAPQTGPGAPVRTADVLKLAIRRKSHALVLALHRPAGPLAPSQDEIDLAAHCVQVGRQFDIQVTDLLLTSASGWVSLRAWLAQQRPEQA